MLYRTNQLLDNCRRFTRTCFSVVAIFEHIKTRITPIYRYLKTKNVKLITHRNSIDFGLKKKKT